MTTGTGKLLTLSLLPQSHHHTEHYLNKLLVMQSGYTQPVKSNDNCFLFLIEITHYFY